jgi:FKBP-type peptidyl-prolyl cis-trans isomerase
MKNLNQNQWIAVSVCLVFLGYLLFAQPIMSFFKPAVQEEAVVETPQAGYLKEEVVVGSGPEVLPGDTVTVHYVGALPDGQVIDSSIARNEPFTFTLGTGAVIRGWDEGLVGMKVGGKRRLVVTPEYGYGEQGSGPVPPNSPLFFEVELLAATTSAAATTSPSTATTSPTITP